MRRGTDTGGDIDKMNELHILNVGRADCSILLLDTEEGRKTVVLDGGGVCFRGRRPLLEFLEARGIEEIDLLILPHLHQDHFGGFYQLIDRIFVKRLVSPCGDLVFCEKVYPVFGDSEYYREYHAAFQYFEQAGTELLPSAGCGDFSFGESRLRCLYPETGSPMPSVVYARELCRRDLTDAEIVRVLERYKAACNGDSSIWLLEHGGQAVALMTGDSTNETLRQALRRSGAVHPAVQKLSHHGIGCRYFSEELQHAISPKYLVVSVDKEHCDEEMKKTVAGLAEAGNSCVHYTFQGDFAYCF